MGGASGDESLGSITSTCGTGVQSVCSVHFLSTFTSSLGAVSSSTLLLCDCVLQTAGVGDVPGGVVLLAVDVVLDRPTGGPDVDPDGVLEGLSTTVGELSEV